MNLGEGKGKLAGRVNAKAKPLEIVEKPVSPIASGKKRNSLKDKLKDLGNFDESPREPKSNLELYLALGIIIAMCGVIILVG